MASETLYRAPRGEDPFSALFGLLHAAGCLTDSVGHAIHKGEATAFERFENADPPAAMLAATLALVPACGAVRSNMARFDEINRWARVGRGDPPSLPEITAAMGRLGRASGAFFLGVRDWHRAALAEARRMDMAAAELSARRAILTASGDIVRRLPK